MQDDEAAAAAEEAPEAAGDTSAATLASAIESIKQIPIDGLPAAAAEDPSTKATRRRRSLAATAAYSGLSSIGGMDADGVPLTFAIQGIKDMLAVSLGETAPKAPPRWVPSAQDKMMLASAQVVNDSVSRSVDYYRKVVDDELWEKTALYGRC